MISFDSENEFELCLMDNQQWMIDQFTLDKNTKFYRQVSIEPYGIMDILAVSTNAKEHLCITVIELKNQNITLINMAQVARYMRYFELALEGSPYEDVFIEGILIGPTLFSGDDVFLAQKLKDIYIYSLGIDPMEGLTATLIEGWNKNGDISEIKKSELFGAIL
jgi:hypothetical protein